MSLLCVCVSVCVWMCVCACVCIYLNVLSSGDAGWLAVMVLGVCGFSFCIVSGGVFPLHVFGGGCLVNREEGKSVRLTRGVKERWKEHAHSRSVIVCNYTLCKSSISDDRQTCLVLDPPLVVQTGHEAPQLRVTSLESQPHCLRFIS